MDIESSTIEDNSQEVVSFEEFQTVKLDLLQQLKFEALPEGSEPSWQFASVVPQPIKPFPFDQLVFATEKNRSQTCKAKEKEGAKVV